MIQENRAPYVCTFKFAEADNVIFIGRNIQIDVKVVPLKIPIQNPFTGKAVEMCFAGASTRRQGLFRYVQKTKAGDVLGG